jgi:hypothetical protein
MPAAEKKTESGKHCRKNIFSPAIARVSGNQPAKCIDIKTGGVI